MVFIYASVETTVWVVEVLQALDWCVPEWPLDFRSGNSFLLRLTNGLKEPLKLVTQVSRVLLWQRNRLGVALNCLWISDRFVSDLKKKDQFVHIHKQETTPTSSFFH